MPPSLLSLQAWIAMACLLLPEVATCPWRSHPQGAPKDHHGALRLQPWGPADAHGHGPPRSTTQNSSMCLTRAWLGRWCRRAAAGDGGVSGAVTSAPCAHSMQRKRSVGQRPVPGVGRPKPQPRAHGPRCRALYQYVGQDVDELSFNVNEVIEILLEGVCVQGERGGDGALTWPGSPP